MYEWLIIINSNKMKPLRKYEMLQLSILIV
jgi:hypothetical protein